MKSIVLMCDGTSNSISHDLSNIVRLYRCLRKDESQHCFYNPGVGTIGGDGWWSERLRRGKAVFEQATGWGIDRDICRTYQFLCEAFVPGDRIYMFGFSRGAYTVRVVAALIEMIGILKPDQVNLIPHALRAYKQINDSDGPATPQDFARVSHIGEVLDSRWAPIHFLGLFDTVSSVIVPGRNFFGLLPGTSRLPFTRTNPSVRAVRHAAAIDERRAMFRLNRWFEGKQHQTQRYNPQATVPQDVKQVWFAGVHADIGGGYPEAQSGLAKLALAWMVREAQAHGLDFMEGRVSRFVMGKNRPDTKDDFSAPDPNAKLHLSLRGVWWLVELVPKLARFRETARWSFLGLYIPWGERRRIAYDTAPTPMVHHSVEERRNSATVDYDPANLPSRFDTE